ncbi:MAG: SPOR domain-containing protein [Flavobacteriales bacterium]|nr:MAG: SPOR domain-containing protein [Flavobacteriales bacterium]
MFYFALLTPRLLKMKYRPFTPHFFTLFFSMILGIAYAQSAESTAERFASESFEDLLEAYKTTETANIKGFRIQIYNGTRREAETRRAEFIKNFPDTKAYLSYSAPEYQVQIGDFRDYFNAQAKALRLRQTYISAFIVETTISLPSVEDERTLNEVQTKKANSED